MRLTQEENAAPDETASGVCAITPLGSARQEQLEADLTRAWRKDPLPQKAMPNGGTAILDPAGVQMAATHLRHEKGAAPN